ncbi:hypothetical protein CQA53_01650 [Helicobacter didelphidarum]|uniref:Toxin-antitoxin system YwqK family antitoxin n=1 Tax=Helicobacter didelphidarum TaxID=2040648 RepID=A0A3D8IQV1_9HELI|nr:hypothetical protein [Helicobacter didelphidarum]RDU66994.1 hypothetical protein CQA53_01650 [Helicobacter didelphidarum]
MRNYEGGRGYYKNGNLKDELLIDAYDNAVMKAYYPNGKLMLETNGKNGKIEGVEKHYHENGKLKMEVPYTNDEREGVLKYYNEEGEYRYEILYGVGTAANGRCANGKLLLPSMLKTLGMGEDTAVCDER